VLDEERHRAGALGRDGVVVAVGRAARDATEQRALADLAAVVSDRTDLDCGITAELDHVERMVRTGLGGKWWDCAAFEEVVQEHGSSL
jgi:hypothetical protein